MDGTTRVRRGERRGIVAGAILFPHFIYLCGPIREIYSSSLPLTLYHPNDVEYGVVETQGLFRN
jgi:hypothetical protein